MKHPFNASVSVAIDRMGGTGEVAKLCEITPASVSGWKCDGMPKARIKFLRLARPEAFRDLRDCDLLEPARREPAAA